MRIMDLRTLAGSTIGLVVPLAVLCCNPALGQSPPAAIMTIDVANYVEYQADIYDASKYGTNPNQTPSTGPGQFGVATIMADIVANK